MSSHPISVLEYAWECVPVHAVEVVEQPLVLGRVLLVVGIPGQERKLGSVHAPLRVPQNSKGGESTRIQRHV